MTSTQTDPGREKRAAPAHVRGLWGGARLGLFSEMIIVSLGVALFSLPGVTALSAFAAGAARLGRHTRGDPNGYALFVSDFLSALRRGWPWSVGVAVGFAAIYFNTTTLAAVDIPGGQAVRYLSVALGFVAVVVLLRACGMWHRESVWSALLPAAARASVSDARGTALLGLGVVLCGLIIWMFAPLAVLVPGLLTLATSAISVRPARPGPRN
jgi:hypothetical protein